MKPSAGRVVPLGVLFILSLVLALAGAHGVSAQTTPAPVDYDDNDGLIDVTTLAQLNAMRYDPNGSGSPSAADRASYAAAFPTPYPAWAARPPAARAASSETT